MFIEKLYHENSLLVRTKLSSICSCREDEAKHYMPVRYANINCDNGLVFRVTSCDSCHEIFVGDFEIKYLSRTDLDHTSKSVEWRRFMAGIYGEEYLKALKQTRGEQKKFYVQNFNRQTQEMLDDLNLYAQDCENKNNK